MSAPLCTIAWIEIPACTNPDPTLPRYAPALTVTAAARQPELQLRLDMYCWGGAGRDSKRHSTAQRTAAQGAE